MPAIEQAPAPQGAPAKNSPGRAGRNLWAAVGVGVALGGLVLGTLYTVKVAFLVVVIVAIGIGVWEITRALAAGGRHAPLIPLLAGTLAILVLAYTRGSEAMVVALLLAALALVIWRLAEPPQGILDDVAASLFALVYVPFLAGFAALMLAPEDGARRVTCFIATVVASDVGGYAVGVLAGRHPMAPSVSPKKSWEGFAGSVTMCALVGGVLITTLLHAAWWQGVLLGLALVSSATLGDLGESLLKRDIGIKDMGTLLPGHGGLMDRLDSLLPSAPVAWLLLAAFVPVPK
jgi:phosphatidate cytidylyltransferase